MNKTKQQIAELERRLDREQQIWNAEWQCLRDEYRTSRLLPWVIVGAGLGIGFIAGKTRGLSSVWQSALKLPAHYANWQAKIARFMPNQD